MEALIVYYSYSGNTRKVAKLLAERLHAESAEIETATAYPSAYDAVVKQGKDEIRRGYLPELKPLGKNPEHYDTIFLGTPVWWYTLAPAVKAFLSRHSLAGKTVCPFITSGGWSGHTEKDIAAAYPGAKVLGALDLTFDAKRMKGPAEAVDNWLRTIA